MTQEKGLKDFFNLIIKVFMIAAICFAIGKQIEITTLIIERGAMLDADPLVVAAKRYDVESCTCLISPTTTLTFNKNISYFTIDKSKEDWNFPPVNLEDWNGTG